LINNIYEWQGSCLTIVYGRIRMGKPEFIRIRFASQNRTGTMPVPDVRATCSYGNSALLF